MSGARRLTGIAALLLVASIVIAGVLVLAKVACPSLAAVGNPWFRSYHIGENPWAGAWAPVGVSPAAPRVASPGSGRQTVP